MIELLIKQWAILMIGLFLSLNVEAQEIKLMSFNIGSSNWMGNRDSVIGRVTFNNPDVFCAIEATGSTRPFLESSLPGYHMLQTFGSNPNLSESHIFLRKNMFTVVDSGFAQMETYGGYSGPGRYVNWVQLEEKTTQNNFLVYASHFVFVFPSNPDSSTIGQYRHADGMVQLMNQHSQLNIPMITVGDFNADSSTKVMQFLMHQLSISYHSTTINNPIDLNDSWYEANPTVKKPGTVGMGSSVVDWILTTTDVNISTAIIDDQGVNGQGNFPSDHRPLIIHFDLSNPTSISKIRDNSGIRVYPNPNTGLFTIKLNNSSNGEIIIYNMVGMVVYLETFNNQSSFEIELPHSISNGIYFVEIIGKFQRSCQKVVVQRE